MVINESTAYKRDYKKIIINKHMIKEKEKIENIKNIIKGFLSGYEDYTIIYM